jgi:hypothetical protein
MNPFDVAILLFLNQFAQWSPRFDECVAFLSGSNLLKGGVIVGMIWWVWFGSEDVHRKRSVLLATLIASVPALIMAKALNVHLLASDVSGGALRYRHSCRCGNRGDSGVPGKFAAYPAHP